MMMGELVECHSGFTYAERPVALTWEGLRLKIVEILAEWRTPEEKHFLVQTTDGRKFTLAYSQSTDTWQIGIP